MVAACWLNVRSDENRIDALVDGGRRVCQRGEAAIGAVLRKHIESQDRAGGSCIGQRRGRRGELDLGPDRSIIEVVLPTERDCLADGSGRAQKLKNGSTIEVAPLTLVLLLSFWVWAPKA